MHHNMLLWASRKLLLGNNRASLSCLTYDHCSLGEKPPGCSLPRCFQPHNYTAQCLPCLHCKLCSCTDPLDLFLVSIVSNFLKHSLLCDRFQVPSKVYHCCHVCTTPHRRPCMSCPRCRGTWPCLPPPASCCPGESGWWEDHKL